MCATCQADYDDPLNRRVHAQPNACWQCGPQVELWDRKGQKVPVTDPIAEAAKGLEAGLVVAVKGRGAFHLAANAINPAAVALLRQRKRRVEKPFAVMVPTVDAAADFCELSDACVEALRMVKRPIVRLPKNPPSRILEQVATRNRYLGVL